MKFMIVLLSLASVALPDKVGLAAMPSDKKVDMDKFSLVWSDEFEGKTLSKKNWEPVWWVTQREDGYVFYLNGCETARASIEEAKDEPMYLTLSVTINGKNAIASDDLEMTGKMKHSAGDTAQFKIDYVRCYQYKNLLK